MASGSVSSREAATQNGRAREDERSRENGPLRIAARSAFSDNAAARDGQTLAVFAGKAEGIIQEHPTGSNGFGYDPLFFFPQINKTFAELSAAEKARYSHRGEAFRKFLEWCSRADLKSSAT